MTANTLEHLDGNFKDIFHKEVVDLIPQVAVLQRGLIDFVPSDKMNGEFYSVPTLLRSNQGVSYLGEAGVVADLADAKPGQMKEAQVKGSELNVRGQMSYKALSQASSTGPRAFKKAAAWLVEDLTNVAHTRIEIAALYGRDGLGVVESVTAVTGSTADVVITDASFAPGIWVTLEGATLDAFTGTVKDNSSGALEILNVTTSTRTIRVRHSGTLANEIAAGDVLFFEGAAVDGGAFNEMVGLARQFRDTSSTLFNIDRSAHGLIQGNEYDAAGAITKRKIVDACMLAVDKGCMTDLTVLVGTKAWAVLWAEDVALRMFDSSYKPSKSESGSAEIEYTSVNGKIKVVCHPMIKNGQALIFNPDDVLWIGSSKPTFEIPGMSERFFRMLDGKNAVELQNYSDLAIYAMKPSQTVLVTGITYAGF